jgi:hypothetical protein
LSLTLLRKMSLAGTEASPYEPIGVIAMTVGAAYQDGAHD